MYKFYLDKTLMPITPSKLQTSIKNKNKTITLINEEEINILKTAGLTEISFEVLLPMINNYPFAVYQNGFQSAGYFLEKIENLKTSKQPFQFIVSRIYEKKLLFSTNMKVSLEDYEIVEDANEGDCIKVSINLKQYRDYGTKTVDIKLDPYKPKPIIKVTTERPTTTTSSTSKTSSASQAAKTVTKGCTVIANGYLFRDSYGNGRGQYRSNYKGKINFINTKGSHPYHLTDMNGGWQGWMLASAIRVV